MEQTKSGGMNSRLTTLKKSTAAAGMPVDTRTTETGINNHNNHHSSNNNNTYLCLRTATATLLLLPSGAAAAGAGELTLILLMKLSTGIRRMMAPKATAGNNSGLPRGGFCKAFHGAHLSFKVFIFLTFLLCVCVEGRLRKKFLMKWTDKRHLVFVTQVLDRVKYLLRWHF